MRPRIANINGVELAYSVEGCGPPVVLVHGLACGRRMWFQQIRALRANFTVITYDQRGHGRSTAPLDRQQYSSAHLAQDLLGLLDHIGIERCHVVGFSLGGGPALSLAIRRPERISALVLAGVGSGTDDVTLIPALVRRWVSLANQEGMPALSEEMLRSEFFKTYATLNQRARCYMRLLIMSTPLHGLVFTLSEVLAARRSLLRMRAALAGIHAPTLVIRGGKDNVCRASSKVLSSAIPEAVQSIIAHAGHMAPLEAPSNFNSLLLSFLAQNQFSARLDKR
jgi:3-oxoadipate enol-lactonase